MERIQNNMRTRKRNVSSPKVFFTQRNYHVQLKPPPAVPVSHMGAGCNPGCSALTQLPVNSLKQQQRRDPWQSSGRGTWKKLLVWDKTISSHCGLVGSEPMMQAFSLKTTFQITTKSWYFRVENNSKGPMINQPAILGIKNSTVLPHC